MRFDPLKSNDQHEQKEKNDEAKLCSNELEDTLQSLEQIVTEHKLKILEDFKQPHCVFKPGKAKILKIYNI